MELQLSGLDIAIFVIFLVAVVAIGLWKSRGETDSEDYFLAGRGLNWWLIGFSLIAANISAEQFVGMSGQAAKDSIGLAVASYEWIAAVTLVMVGFLFLPQFLSSGIYTIPQFLEYRFTHTARTIMSALMVIIYVGVTIATVTYLGAKALDPLLGGEFMGIEINITSLSWMVGIAAAIYVAAGGLAACVWADLLQGSALIVGGIVIMVLAFMALDNPGAYENVTDAHVYGSLALEPGATLGEKLGVLKEQKMHMILPADNDFLPWTAMIIGIWIPNLYYWGLNQYIMQRTLGAKSLAQGQKGIAFAATLKLIIPFIVCVPGIIAFTLYGDKMADLAMTSPSLNAPMLAAYDEVKANPQGSKLLFPFNEDFLEVQPEIAAQMLAYNVAVAGIQPPEDAPSPAAANKFVIDAARVKSADYQVTQTLVGYDYDAAFPLLVRYLTPNGWRGFVVAALMGAVISSLASMLNAASTIFTMDIYREYINRNATQRNLVWVGRATVPVCVVIGCLIAPQLANPKFSGAFAYIQEFQGFISPGVLMIFLFGLFVPRAPRISGVVGLALSPIVYGALYFGAPDMAFLNRMAITCGVIAAAIIALTLIKPLSEPVTLPRQENMELETSRPAVAWGLGVVAITLMLYIYFW